MGLISDLVLYPYFKLLKKFCPNTCEAYQWLKLLINKIYNNASIEELHYLDEDISVCVYTCCLELKNHFHQIILQEPCIIYMKTGLCILKSF